jgi:hypothetical protein
LTPNWPHAVWYVGSVCRAMMLLFFGERFVV